MTERLGLHSVCPAWVVGGMFGFRAIYEAFLPPYEFKEMPATCSRSVESTPLIALSGFAIGVVLSSTRVPLSSVLARRR